MKSMIKHSALLLTVVLALGCDKNKDKDDDNNQDTTTTTAPTTSDGMGHSDDQTSEPDVTTTVPQDTSSSGEDSSGEQVECGVPCQILEQDCPTGQHCVPYICDMQQTGWDSTICVPVGLKNPGESCVSPWEGTDVAEQCAQGSMCWNGVCKEQCTGTVEDAKCSSGDAACLLANEGALAVCMEKCDPFNSNCPENELCIPLGEEAVAVTFACIGGGGGVHGDPCMWLNGCAPGFYCAIEKGPGSVDAPGCDAIDGCCTPYCKLDGGDGQCPGAAEECVQVLINPEPGYENVGWCVIPAD